ncbi:MAG: DUF1611 domain-containing protein [Microscillaceae bacterium]|jgi:uncharacterized NAD-dependent epimerase/dehydratase family protein|nr:DUF1611 domain-containing protein [Microscillaceae bacterium]
MKPRAIVLTDGNLDNMNAKTAHGLIRGTDRFEIVGVIDPPQAGKDAGTVLDGKPRNIPIFADVQTALQNLPTVDTCIVGVATVGGMFPGNMLAVVKECIEAGLHIVNGLHDFLNDRPEMLALAQKRQVTLTDVRRPKAKKDLHFWTGEIFKVKAPIIAVLGMDCAMGKRTTCRMIRQALEQKGTKAQMIYTGQTGWMQGGQYGFIFDSTLNDFISGELEYAIVSCYRETGAEVILLEGQSALRNPSGPAGSEFLVSGNAKYTVLVHAPKRQYYDNIPEWGKIPPVESEIALANMYGSQVIALALNTQDCTREEAFAYQKEYSEKLQIPILLPIEEGVEAVVEVIRQLLRQN